MFLKFHPFKHFSTPFSLDLWNLTCLDTGISTLLSTNISDWDIIRPTQLNYRSILCPNSALIFSHFNPLSNPLVILCKNIHCSLMV